MKSLLLSWGSLHFRVNKARRPPGPELVFLNSLGTDLRMWDAVVDALPSAGRSLQLDFRGHGLSSTSTVDYEIEDLAADVLAAMDAAEIQEAVIVGCSVGGLIAQQLALLSPKRVRALILSNTAAKLGDSENWHARIAAVEAQGMGPMADTILPRWFGPTMLADPEAALWQTMLARCDAKGYTQLCRAIAGVDIRHLVETITVPCLVIGGSEDKATPPDMVRELHTQLPNARWALFENVGHLPAIEATDQFTSTLSTFLADLTALEPET